MPGLPTKESSIVVSVHMPASVWRRTGGTAKVDLNVPIIVQIQGNPKKPFVALNFRGRSRKDQQPNAGKGLFRTSPHILPILGVREAIFTQQPHFSKCDPIRFAQITPTSGTWTYILVTFSNFNPGSQPPGPRAQEGGAASEA